MHGVDRSFKTIDSRAGRNLTRRQEYNIAWQMTRHGVTIRG